MGLNGSEAPPITAPWPVKDIVYVCIMGPIMLCAFLEWILFVSAFNYCLYKVMVKAEHWSIILLSIFMCISFTVLRLIFLPVMVVTLPLPPQVTQYFPPALVSFLQWFAFWSFAGLLTIPWLFCVFQLVTNSIGRQRRIKEVLDEWSAPKMVIVMPVYNEDPEVLHTAINSVVTCDYPATCVHVFVSFDGDEENELYLKTIENMGVPLTLDTYPPSIDVTYRTARITISRFPHGGKRKAQKATFKLVDKIYTEYLKRNDNLFILFIDSDCILDAVCIQNFMYEMQLKPGSKHNMLAMTGIITSTTVKHSLITVLQDMEYVHGQLFERSVESGCGAVTCLPGALTCLRFSAFRKMAKYYFADKAEQCDDLFDYGKCHLGEDRWLTHLFMIGAKERYQIQLCTGAFCKTEAVQTYKSLLKQRRRWFLGYITNEACMLTDVRLWVRYPLLCVVRFMQNTIRTTALLFFIMVVSLLTTEQAIANLPVGFIAVSLGLNWILMFYFGVRLHRYKIWAYPLMFVINPFFNWVYMTYGIFTAGQRTWGGPRADAATADAHTTPQEAIEKAVEDGDDLNVIPETFKPAVEEQYPEKMMDTQVQPSDMIDGRFAAPDELPGGWYQQHNDSGLTLPNTMPRNPDAPHIPLHPRASFDSYMTNDTGFGSVHTPRRVESFMGDEDQRKYAFAQQAAREGAFGGANSPGGGSLDGVQQGRVFEVGDDGASDYNAYNGNGMYGKGDWSEQTQPVNPFSNPTESDSTLANGHNVADAMLNGRSRNSSVDGRTSSPLRHSMSADTNGSGIELHDRQPRSANQRMPLMRDNSYNAVPHTNGGSNSGFTSEEELPTPPADDDPTPRASRERSRNRLSKAPPKR